MRGVRRGAAGARFVLSLVALGALSGCADDEAPPPAPAPAPASAPDPDPGAVTPPARLRWIMGRADRRVLDIQRATVEPVDAVAIGAHLGEIRAGIEEVARLRATGHDETDDLLATLAALSAERLAALEGSTWTAATAADLYGKLRAVCDGCHQGAPALDDRPPWEAALRRRLEQPSARACGGCHPDQLATWQRTLHARAWLDPVYRMAAGDPRRVDCRGCHSMLPILADDFSTALEWRPVFRPYNEDDGVGCATCHLRADGTVAAAGPVEHPEAPCRPVADPRLTSPEACGACHNPTHRAYDEWATSRAAAAGTTCLDCHGAHAFGGGDDPEFVGRALVWRAERAGDEVHLVLENRAAHRLPGEVPSRALRIEWRFAGGDGAELDPVVVVGLKRPAKGLAGVADTRLAPDETRTLRQAIPPGARRVVVLLLWQPSPLVQRSDWFELGRWEDDW